MNVVTDENMTDENGNPLNYVNIQDEYTLICHPVLQEKLEQAIELFFEPKNKGDKNE